MKALTSITKSPLAVAFGLVGALAGLQVAAPHALLFLFRWLGMSDQVDQVAQQLIAAVSAGNVNWLSLIMLL